MTAPVKILYLAYLSMIVIVVLSEIFIFQQYNPTLFWPCFIGLMMSVVNYGLMLLTLIDVQEWECPCHIFYMLHIFVPLFIWYHLFLMPQGGLIIQRPMFVLFYLDTLTFLTLTGVAIHRTHQDRKNCLPDVRQLHFATYLDLRAFDEQKNCPICIQPFTAKQEITLLRCRHIFHLGCLGSWMNVSRTCPTCRSHILGREDDFGERMQPIGGGDVQHDQEDEDEEQDQVDEYE